MLKESVPHAFTPAPPFRPHVIFIDGQIKLMKSDAVRTWESFLRMQFTRHIDACFEKGASVVVLGFDNYAHVPCAKNMTQRKRMQDVEVLQFTADLDLPDCIPYNWASAIKNRAFKTKVIGYVMRNLRARYKHAAGQTLVLDYMGLPEVIGHPITLPALFTQPNSADLRRGECDIKAFSWMELGPMLIESTDGDFLPIALLQVSRRKLSYSPRIALHRIKTRLKDAAGSTACTAKREYEYVDITALQHFVEQGSGLAYSLRAPDLPAPPETMQSPAPPANDPVMSFAALVAMTGCDFCMSLPQLGPVRLWQLRQHMRTRDAGTEMGQLVFIVLVLSEVNAKNLQHAGQYKRIQEKARQAMELEHACAAYELFVSTMLRQKTLAQTTRQRLWTTDRMLAHVKNTLWTMQYWCDLHEHCDAMDGEHGFERKGNSVAFVGT